MRFFGVRWRRSLDRAGEQCHRVAIRNPKPRIEMSSQEYHELKTRLHAIEKEVYRMSAEIQALKALVTEVIADVNAKLAALSTAGLSDEDKATIADITAGLTALDNQVKGAPAPAEAPVEPASA